MDRTGTTSGRVLVEDPGSMASLAVVADGEWTLSFESLTSRPEVGGDGSTLGDPLGIQ